MWSRYVEGEGAVELVVDCKAKPVVELADGRGTISDIELDKGLNHILLKWVPLRAESKVRLRWQDIKGQAERGFSF